MMNTVETVTTKKSLDFILGGVGDQLVVVPFTRDGEQFPDEEFAEMAQKYDAITFVKFVVNEKSGLTESADHFSNLTVIFYRNAQEIRRLAGPARIGEIQTEIEFLDDLDALVSVGSATKRQKTCLDSVSGSMSDRSRLEELKREAEAPYYEMPLSDMPADFVGKLIGVNLKKILNREKLVLSGLPETSDNLNDLYERLFNRIVPMIRIESYPNDLADEGLKSKFVYALLIEVIFELHTKYGLTDDDLVVERNHEFIAKLGGRWKEIEADFVVMGRKKGGERQILFAVFKSSTCGAALKQCAVYAKECGFVLNGGGVVYSLCSTGVYFSVVKYEPKGDPKKPELDFEVMQQTRFLFTEMAKNKDDWKANNTKIVNILYSILWEQLGLNN